MKQTNQWTWTGLLLVAALVLTLGWFQLRLHAEDGAKGEEGLKTKLAQLVENNNKMEATLKTIEENLNFAKIRAMSGGKH